jgi:GT2 family glycosyltransferase
LPQGTEDRTSREASGTTAIVLVMYGNWAHTRNCLEAIQARLRGRWRVVLVDNASLPTAAAAAEAWVCGRAGRVLEGGADAARCDVLPEFTLIRRGTNGGFAAGVNVGLAWAAHDPTVDTFWLLNNDTEPEADALVALRDALASLPSAGMAGSLLLRADAPERVQALGGGRYWPALGWSSQLGENRLRQSMPTGPVKLDYVSGASLLIERNALREVGPLPEDYFMYVEDIAWCVSLRRKGWAAYAVPSSVVHHAEGLSAGRKAISDYYMPRNHLWLARAHHPAFAISALAFLTARMLAPKILRGQWRRAATTLRGLRDGLNRGPNPTI